MKEGSRRPNVHCRFKKTKKNAQPFSYTSPCTPPEAQTQEKAYFFRRCNAHKKNHLSVSRPLIWRCNGKKNGKPFPRLASSTPCAQCCTTAEGFESRLKLRKEREREARGKKRKQFASKAIRSQVPVTLNSPGAEHVATREPKYPPLVSHESEHAL